MHLKQLHAHVTKIVKDDHRTCSARVMTVTVVTDKGESIDVCWAQSDYYINEICTEFYLNASKALSDCWDNLKVGDEVVVNESEGYTYCYVSRSDNK